MFEKCYVISRSYDERNFFPVAVCRSKDAADEVTRIFGGIVTEVPILGVYRDLSATETEVESD